MCRRVQDHSRPSLSSAALLGAEIGAWIVSGYPGSDGSQHQAPNASKMDRFIPVDPRTCRRPRVALIVVVVVRLCSSWNTNSVRVQIKFSLVPEIEDRWKNRCNWRSSMPRSWCKVGSRKPDWVDPSCNRIPVRPLQRYSTLDPEAKVLIMKRKQPIYTLIDSLHQSITIRGPMDESICLKNVVVCLCELPSRTCTCKHNYQYAENCLLCRCVVIDIFRLGSAAEMFIERDSARYGCGIPRHFLV